MTQLAPHHRHSFADYLETEEVSRVRHEFYAGEIYAIAGGSPEHAAIAAVITASLVRQLEGSACRAYSLDLRVRVLATGLATYPDVTVVCGPSLRDPKSATHVTNPKLVVEVLSPGTEDYDRGEKLEHYKLVPSLSAVVLVHHRTELVELWSRNDDAWSYARFGAGEDVPLAAIQCTLAVDTVYGAARDA
ncbi:MAG: Uma2 family endonuclease [Pseudomonadota bacterium]